MLRLDPKLANYTTEELQFGLQDDRQGSNSDAADSFQRPDVTLHVTEL